MDIQIQPLQFSTVNNAIVLRDTLFPDLKKHEHEILLVSLNPSNYQVHTTLGIIDLDYWTAIDIESKNISGLVGLYTEQNDPDSIWLGWYCVDPKYRGYKIGTRLLSFAIEEAKKRGKNYLYLYTTLDEDYATARMQYKNIGFVHYKSVKKNLYYRLSLRN